MENLGDGDAGCPGNVIGDQSRFSECGCACSDAGMLHSDARVER